MSRLAIDVVIATIVFLVVSAVWDGALGFTQIAQALVCGMILAAIKVGTILFGGDRG